MASYTISIDIKENTLLRKGKILNILLKDRSTNKNIIWATDSYKDKIVNFKPYKSIKPELITGINNNIIQPRASKSNEEQKRRTKDKAEVFTPLDVIDKINSAVENYEINESNWKNYVRELKLEITCGEAPFIVTRYDPTANGTLIGIKNRVGFLDRKLKVVSQYCNIESNWLKWAKEAYKSSYGYEWQGDNLLIARENLLYTFIDYFEDKFNKKPDLKLQEAIAKIISWNIFQMDGLKCTIPMSCKKIKKDNTQLILIKDDYSVNISNYLECEGCTTSNKMKHNGKYVNIKNWTENKIIRFVDLFQEK